MMAIPRAFASLFLVLVLQLLVSPLCCMANNILYPGESLKSGEALEAGGKLGGFQFIMQEDCNLVLHNDYATPDWQSHTNGLGENCYLTFNTDASLVIYDGTTKSVVRVISPPIGEGGYVLILKSTGDLVIYGPNHWDPILVGGLFSAGKTKGAPHNSVDYNTLYSGDYLKSGEELNTGNQLGGFSFVMQKDCNLVLYGDYPKPRWASNTNGLGENCYLNFTTKGSLVIYDGNNNFVYVVSPPIGEGDYVLILQSTGNLVIYGPKHWYPIPVGGLFSAGKTKGAPRISMVVNE